MTENTPAELKDDFGLFVNKDWILQAQIPAGESKTGSMEDVDRTLMDQQIALMKNESLTGHDAELVHKLYALVSNWEYRDAQGVEPAMSTMEAIQGIDSLEAVTGYLCDRNNLMRFYPLTMAVSADFIDPDIYITQIGTPSLMLQDSAEYTGRTQAGELYYTLYEQLGTYILTRLGYSDDETAQVIENAFAFDALMARHCRAAGGLRLRRLLPAVRHRLAHAGAARLSRHPRREGHPSDTLYAHQRDACAVRRIHRLLRHPAWRRHVHRAGGPGGRVVKYLR